ncbi:MAG: succinylglutamate desuccinylase/aspartoacylase family protein [bacterium]|nr:succinylglutamate desuccinylase/aspartoacylase family protein [bacterium]
MTPEGIFKISGAEPGKTAIVLAGVHGNEPNGVAAIQSLVASLSVSFGIVYLIIGNPRAVEKGVRSTEMNLNRAFRPGALLNAAERGSYERRRALDLMPYFDMGDALLDLHSSASPQSIPFAICEPHSYPVAERLPVSIRSSGWDTLEPGATEYYMNQRGKVGICLECGYHGDTQGVTFARESVLTFLSALGFAPHSAIASGIRTQRTVAMFHIHITETDFSPSRAFADFEKVRTGELIGTDGGRSVPAPTNCVVVFCRERHCPGEEAFLLGREEF